MKSINPKVDIYFTTGCGRCPLGNTPQCKVHNWVEEMEKLRSIILDCGLDEELKWGVPCYTFQKSNILLIGAFKEYCAISFFKGALLNDAGKILSKPGENTQAGRIIRFTNLRQISESEQILRAYVHEAVEVEKAGLRVDFITNPEPVPEEFQNKLNENAGLKTAFEALTPGRRRAYILYFSQPKQSQTRQSRIEKCIPLILMGKGLNEDFKARGKAGAKF